MPSSLYKFTDVSKKHTDSTFKAEEEATSTNLHGITTHNMVFITANAGNTSKLKSWSDLPNKQTYSSTKLDIKIAYQSFI